jgi:hypothetical protein
LIKDLILKLIKELDVVDIYFTPRPNNLVCDVEICSLIVEAIQAGASLLEECICVGARGRIGTAELSAILHV